MRHILFLRCSIAILSQVFCKAHLCGDKLHPTLISHLCGWHRSTTGCKRDLGACSSTSRAIDTQRSSSSMKALQQSKTYVGAKENSGLLSGSPRQLVRFMLYVGLARVFWLVLGSSDTLTAGMIGALLFCCIELGFGPGEGDLQEDSTQKTNVAQQPPPPPQVLQSPMPSHPSRFGECPAEHQEESDDEEDNIIIPDGVRRRLVSLGKHVSCMMDVARDVVDGVVSSYQEGSQAYTQLKSSYSGEDQANMVEDDVEQEIVQGGFQQSFTTDEECSRQYLVDKLERVLSPWLNGTNQYKCLAKAVMTMSSKESLSIHHNDWARDFSMALNMAYELGHVSMDQVNSKYFLELDQCSREFRQHCLLFGARV